MKQAQAIEVLNALAQPTRMQTFRRLVRAEPRGLAAGALAEAADVPNNTLSTHLAILEQAQLVKSRREGRSIIYRANLKGVQNMLTFLIQDCCCGRSDICRSVVRTARDCCGDDCCNPDDAKEKSACNC